MTAHFLKASPGWDITADTFMDMKADSHTNELFYSPNRELLPTTFRVHINRCRLYTELFFCAYCKDLPQPVWILSRLCI